MYGLNISNPLCDSLQTIVFLYKRKVLPNPVCTGLLEKINKRPLYHLSYLAILKQD